MFDKTVTLFNFHAGTGKWYTTVFTGVDLGVSRGKSATPQSGTTNGDNVSLLINMTPEIGLRYVPPADYVVLPDPSGKFTFNPERDFFADGAHPLAEPVTEADYDTGFYDEMNASTDGVYMISSAEYFGLIPHFELGGR